MHVCCGRIDALQTCQWSAAPLVDLEPDSLLSVIAQVANGWDFSYSLIERVDNVTFCCNTWKRTSPIDSRQQFQAQELHDQVPTAVFQLQFLIFACI